MMFWLIHSMKPKFRCQYLLPKTTKQISDAMSQTYLKVGNTTKVYKIKQAISQLKQGDLPLAAYYSNPWQIWDKMDPYLTFCPKRLNDIVIYDKHVEKFCIYKLLADLHPDFEQIRVNIIAKVPFPSLNQVYAHLHYEENPRNTMTQSAPGEKSAIVSSSQRGGCEGSGMWDCGSRRFGGFSYERDKLKCEHCDCLHHTKETCWDLQEHPIDVPFCSFTSRGRSRNHFGGNRLSAHSITFTLASKSSLAFINTSTPIPNNTLSYEEIDAFCRFVTQLEPPTTLSTSTFTHSRTFASVLSVSLSNPSSS